MSSTATAEVPGRPAPVSRGQARAPSRRLARVLILVVTGAGAVVVARQVPAALHWGAYRALAAAALAVATMVGELFPLHFRHRTETETFSVTDVIWTAALLLTPASVLLLSVVAGVLLSQIVRRLPLEKVAFNAGQFVLAMWAAELVFRLIPHGGALESATWGAAAAGMAVNFVVNQGLMALVISLTANEPLRAVVLDSLSLDVLLASGHVTIGIIAAVLWTLAPGGVLIAAVPVLLSHMACSGWLRSLQERDRMRDLYQAGQVLLERLETDGDFRPFLELVARMMDAETAEIVIVRDGVGYLQDASGAMAELRPPPPPPEADPPPGHLRRGHGGVTRTAPIGPGEGTLGVRRSRALSSTERSLLEALAAQVYVKLRHSSVFARAVSGEQELARIISSSSDGIFVTGEDGRIVSWSPAMERITGVAAAAAVGSPIGEILRSPSTEDDVWAGFASARPEGGERVETGAFERPDGTVGWVRFSRSALRSPDGGPSGVVVVARDVSADIQAEQAKTNFIAAISHELRTPLTPLKGYLSLFASGQMAADATGSRESFGVMLRQAERLERLINDLIDASQMEIDASPTRLEEVDVVGLAASAVAESFEGEAGTPVLFEPRVPSAVVRADPLRVKQVLASLISNAVKYSPVGSPVVVETNTDDGAGVVSVRDRGEGIPAEQQQRIFERFYKIDNGSTRVTGGVGLGLYIAKQLVDSMGGRLWVNSTPGEGSTFSFSLPLAEAKGPG
jgi:PAS domain S-box-containing protein